MNNPIADIDILSDFDMFFYYGQNDLSLETQHDIMLNVMQPKRSLLGNRSNDAAGVMDYENSPIGMNISILLPFDIVTSISKRNQTVSNGENGYPDRRVAISQSNVKIQAEKGNVNITIQYRALADFKDTDVSMPLGIGG